MEIVKFLKGWFYAQDLSLVHKDPDAKKSTCTWAIERLVENRTRRGVEELLVKWKGYSEQFNSWIPAISIINK